MSVQKITARDGERERERERESERERERERERDEDNERKTHKIDFCFCGTSVCRHVYHIIMKILVKLGYEFENCLVYYCV